MNISQRHILTVAQTTKCVLAKSDAIKGNLFLDRKIFPLRLSGGEKEEKIKAGKSCVSKGISGMQLVAGQIFRAA